MPEKQHIYTSTSLEETESIAKEILFSLTPAPHATLVTLSGNLGAGKTAFTKACATFLGVTETVTSPTFVILKKYSVTHPIFKSLIHIDAYRLESGRELAVLGFDKLLSDPTNLILLEWPELVPDVLPSPDVSLSFETVGETTRTITRK